MPVISAITAPSPAQDKASWAARNTLCASRALTKIRRSGSSPSSNSPSAEISPYSCPAKSSLAHKSCRCALTRSAKAAVKPLAAPTPPMLAAQTSCKAPCCSPPPRQRSAASKPNGVKAGGKRNAASCRRAVMTSRDLGLTGFLFMICSSMCISLRAVKADRGRDFSEFISFRSFRPSQIKNYMA